MTTTRMARRIGQAALAVLLLSSSPAFAGPILFTPVSGPSAADTMVNMLLGLTPNITVVPGSASYVGSDLARGLFSDGTDFLPFTAGGVVMSTGLASNLPTPPGPFDFGTDLGQAGDARLSAIAGGDTHDAGLLTFMFTPDGTDIQLQFVFGSNEYLGFVGGAFFNDTFGAFLDDGATVRNIALVPPGTGAPVTIDNVNAASNGPYFFDNANFSRTIAYGGLVGINPGLPLTVHATVVPGQSYRLTLGIADHGDGFVDSGVLLAGQSFLSTGVPAPPEPAPAPVPEPATLLLLGAGCCAVVRNRNRRGAVSTPVH